LSVAAEISTVVELSDVLPGGWKHALHGRQDARRYQEMRRQLRDAPHPQRL